MLVHHVHIYVHMHLNMHVCMHTHTCMFIAMCLYMSLTHVRWPLATQIGPLYINVKIQGSSLHGAESPAGEANV